MGDRQRNFAQYATALNQYASKLQIRRMLLAHYSAVMLNERKANSQ